MQNLEGKPLSPGLARGTAVVFGYEFQRKTSLAVANDQQPILRVDVQAECDRVDTALEMSARDLSLFTNLAHENPSLATAAKLISAHTGMARELAASVKAHIARNLVGVEKSLDYVVGQWVSRLQLLEDEYLRAREVDIRDVGQRMMRHLVAAASLHHVDFPDDAIVVARELVPSDAIALAKSGVLAIVTTHGSRLGHAAIIARALGIPAVSGIANVTDCVAPGDHLLVDGTTGIVTVSPTVEVAQTFRSRLDNAQCMTTVNSFEIQDCKTRDETEITLFGNVGLPQEVGQVLSQGLAGVGLFRSEFLYLESLVRPDSESQRIVYTAMAQELGDKPLVIRTFDLGGEKLPPFLTRDSKIDQSRLSLRGLRFSLAERELFVDQLNAIVDAAQTADVRVLFPMVIGGHDLQQAITCVDKSIKERGALRRPQLGAMIETPAALFCLDEILELCDFVAIGTNDLTQYLLAADRDLAESCDDCTAMHPVVLRAILGIVEAAQRWDCAVCVCGEEAGDPRFAELLIGLGIRELSVSPSRATELRSAIGRIELEESQLLTKQALRCQCSAELRDLFSESGKAPFLASASELTSSHRGRNA